MKTVCRYVVIMLILMHWAACALRILNDIQDDPDAVWLSEYGFTPNCRRCDFYNGHSTEECEDMYGKSSTTMYVAALAWSLAALNGSFEISFTISELVLNLFISLIGCIVLAFMIGEIANALCNLDPASNEYKMKVDNLNDYIIMKGFSSPLRKSLREYFSSSKSLFRFNFNRSLLSCLSPNLQRIVANKDVGAWIKQIPVLAQGVRCACNFKVGSKVMVKLARQNKRTNLEAVILKYESFLNYTVEYRDGFTEMQPHSNLNFLKNNINHSVVDATNNELSGLISELALALTPQLYLANEYIIPDSSINDTMYIFVSGRAWLHRSRRQSYWRPTKQMRSPPMILTDQNHSVAGHDISMQLVGGPVTRRYVVQAVGKALCNALHAGRFRSIISSGRFVNLHSSMRKLAGWSLLKHLFMQIGELAIMEIERRMRCSEAATLITKTVRTYVAGKRFIRLSQEKISRKLTKRGKSKYTLRSHSTRKLYNMSHKKEPPVFEPIWVRYLWKQDPNNFINKIQHYRYQILSGDHNAGIFFSRELESHSTSSIRSLTVSLSSPTCENRKNHTLSRNQNEDEEVMQALPVPISAQPITTAPGKDPDINSAMAHLLTRLEKLDNNMHSKLRDMEAELGKMNVFITLNDRN